MEKSITLKSAPVRGISITIFRRMTFFHQGHELKSIKNKFYLKLQFFWVVGSAINHNSMFSIVNDDYIPFRINSDSLRIWKSRFSRYQTTFTKNHHNIEILIKHLDLNSINPTDRTEGRHSFSISRFSFLVFQFFVFYPKRKTRRWTWGDIPCCWIHQLPRILHVGRQPHLPHDQTLLPRHSQ